jgi:adenine-specific DNA-methyltransferase
VLELNAEDGGERRFILCSSTEATDKEPDKNICRDVCAQRMRRVIEGVGTNGMAKGFTWAQGGEFAYLELDKIEPADLMFEAKPSHAVELLSLRRFGVVQAAPAGLDDGVLPIFKLGRVDDCDILVCSVVTESVLAQLVSWPAPRIAVYSRRPASMARLLEAKGVQANCYGLNEALRFGQSKAAKRKTAAASLGVAA